MISAPLESSLLTWEKFWTEVPNNDVPSYQTFQLSDPTGLCKIDPEMGAPSGTDRSHRLCSEYPQMGL